MSTYDEKISAVNQAMETAQKKIDELNENPIWSARERKLHEKCKIIIIHGNQLIAEYKLLLKVEEQWRRNFQSQTEKS